jgi:hypothetical protein
VLVFAAAFSALALPFASFDGNAFADIHMSDSPGVTVQGFRSITYRGEVIALDADAWRVSVDPIHVSVFFLGESFDVRLSMLLLFLANETPTVVSIPITVTYNALLSASVSEGGRLAAGAVWFALPHPDLDVALAISTDSGTISKALSETRARMIDVPPGTSTLNMTVTMKGFASIPEPTTGVLLGIGITFLIGWSAHVRKHRSSVCNASTSNEVAPKRGASRLNASPGMKVVWSRRAIRRSTSLGNYTDEDSAQNAVVLAERGFQRVAVVRLGLT